MSASKKLDDAFFRERRNVHAHSKGIHMSHLAPGVTSDPRMVGKPWKKHNNKKSKEKLRRVYRELDDH